MKAIVYYTYGSPDVLKLEEIPKPIPKDNEVLLKVHAASINPYDLHYLRGKPFPLRLIAGLIKPKHKILGVDVAGRIEAVGRNVEMFQPGDEVFGDICECELGGLAEYVCAHEDVLAVKPDSMTFEEAAAVPMAAVSALQGLRDKGQIQPGQKVLINGASGGVGTFAVQIAKSFEAEVTGVCSTRNVDMVRSIGADHVIDYTQEDFTQNGRRYDLIVDTVGNRSVSDHKRALKNNGICVVIGYSSSGSLFQVILQGPWISKTEKKKIITFSAKPNNRDLAFLSDLFEAGNVSSVIDRQYPLREVPEALRYLEEGHARGKIVIAMEHHNKT